MGGERVLRGVGERDGDVERVFVVAGELRTKARMASRVLVSDQPALDRDEVRLVLVIGVAYRKSNRARLWRSRAWNWPFWRLTT